MQINVVGMLAETTTTMTFCNPFGRVLEGNLYFPLPDGATLSGYGLDVNGLLVDGVIVEKEKGQVVFEKEVRKGIDPGLVEWAKGNNFKTRVYPIPANGCRTLMVKYVANLDYETSTLKYTVPLNYKNKLAQFLLNIITDGSNSTPSVKLPGLKKLPFYKTENGYAAKTTINNKALVGQLTLTYADKYGRQVTIERTPNAETHFLVNDKLPTASTTASVKPKQPGLVTILWDASNSRAQSNHQKELDVLAAFFARFNSRPIVVKLITFANITRPIKIFTIINGKAEKLVNELRNTTYDGGTQLGSISPASSDKISDLYLLFSDGLSNFGLAQAKGFKAPLFAFSDDLTLNSLYLRWLAQQSGGDFFNLASTTPAQAVAALGGASLSVMSITCTTGKVEQVFPQVGQPVHQQLLITGKLLSPTAELVVDLGIQGVKQQRLHYSLSTRNSSYGDIVARFWAQQKVNELAVLPEQNHQALLNIGQKYNLVTPATSLIVLESLNQYIEHNIRPPEMLADMRTQWDRVMTERQEQKQRENADKLANILSMWERRVAWWNMKFRYPPNFRYIEESSQKSAARSRRNGSDDLSLDAPVETMSAPMPAPSAPPAEEEKIAESATPKPTEKKDKTSKKPTDMEQGQNEPTIEIQPWSPDTPYLKKLKSVTKAQRYQTYLEQKQIFGTSPAFFLDCADFFAQMHDKALSLQILSNVSELQIDDAALLRALAYKLRQLGYLDLAAMVLEEVLRLRPEEPQSYRDLALVLADQNKFKRSMELLAHVVMNRWDRFEEIELIALMELNRIIPKAKAKGIKIIPIDPRLVKLLDLDVRISLSWDTDLTDIDLWVIEPSGEKAYYGHNQTTIGGLVSRDFTQGYGPEEYVLKKAMHGTYKIETNFFGSRAQSLTGAVTLQLDLFTNYGRANEKRKTITLRLTEAKETFTVGTMDF
ncbi:MAG: DUF2135 domain-containing protein [Deltaproteobacteria bacterium]|nr:DUF2135 domain-containing protein [Deltaproteobacteria bacterium]